MKKLMVLLVLVLVAVGAFADTNIGVNMRGAGDGVYPEGVPPIGLEVGVTGDYAGIYGVFGLIDASALVGVTLSVPETPLFIFGGVGMQLIKVTEVTSHTHDGYTQESWLWMDWNEPVVLEAGETSDSYLTTQLLYEAGAGIDMGPVYTKLGYFNDGDHGFSFSMGVSFN